MKGRNCIRGNLKKLAAAMTWLLGVPVAAQTSLDDVNQRQFAIFEESICPAPDGSTTPFPPLASVAEDPSITPTKIFDNLYFVGNLVDSAWVLQTSEGLIVFDAMFDYEVEPHLLAGMEKLGLDAADIKYVVVAHGHADHFGGAALLQERYGAQVIMSNTEWHYLYDTQVSGSAFLPKRDITVLDGDNLILGNTEVQFVNTPGHTPGTISSIFTVRDGNQTHLAGLWGGTAMNFLDNDDIRVHKRSAERFRGLDERMDVILSNHQYADGTVLKIPLIEARQAGQPHPYVVGNAKFQEWMGISLKCADAWLELRNGN